MKNLSMLLNEAIDSRDAAKIKNLPPYDVVENSTDRSMTTLYRVAFRSQLDNIFKNGYSRDFTGSKGGNLYGPGVYCTFRLEDSIHNVKTKPEYGDCIVQMRLTGGFQNFIIFDERLARMVYGNKWTIKDQLQTVAGFDEQTSENIQRQCGRCSSLYHHRTAPAALNLWLSYRGSLFTKHGVRGIIYIGNRDGNCALPYDFSSVIPFAVSFDQGRTFQKKFNRELYVNLSEHPDVEFRYGGRFMTVFKGIKGFVMVKNNSGKYNIVSPETHEPISPVWFEEVNATINPRNGTFGFTYRGIEFTGSIYTPPGGTEIGCVLDPYGDPYCDFSDLDDTVDDIHAEGCHTFLEYAEKSNEETTDLDVRESLRRVIGESVRSVLFEDRTVDKDGTVTIDNFDDIAKMMSPDSSDDVWFVQIVKRHKDNMNQYFAHNACEYVKHYLLHDAKDLMDKRDEIITLCTATNSRAYIQLNKRSLVSVTDYANSVLKKRFEKYNSWRKGHEIEVAAGQSKDWPERKLCFLDVDSDDENVYKKVMVILKQNGITPMWEYRSMNNGWHILLPDKEQARSIDWSVIDNGNNFGRFSTVGLEIDKPVLLYASLKPNGYGLQQRVQKNKLNKIGHHHRSSSRRKP